MTRILVADDDDAICRTLALHYRDKGYDVQVARCPDEALPYVLAGGIDAVISDVRMPGRGGLAMLREIRDQRPEVPVIIMTAFHDLDTTVDAMQGGAADYVPKPLDIRELDAALARVLSRETGAAEGLDVGEPGAAAPLIVGQSRAMKEVFKQIGLVAASPVTVLLQGESGTGKELVARAIHRASARRDAPFMAVNCAALVETLLESEMFGHERGAFTGAVSAHKGKVELVGDGTLFLDEIAELSPSMQGKLLRVLEAREFTPVGGSRAKLSAARFIAATNLELAELVAAGRFREDLYYRLNVLAITLPPLRDRRDDIPPLVEHLLRRINRDLNRSVARVSAEAMRCLQAYDWPGNVRELDNVLMKAAVMEHSDTLTTAFLADEIAAACDAVRTGDAAAAAADPAPRSLKELERHHIQRVLDDTGWHKGRACEILGISRPRLERRIKEFGLAPT